MKMTNPGLAFCGHPLQQQQERAEGLLRGTLSGGRRLPDGEEASDVL